MHPTAELNALARRKLVLRARIGVRRLECAAYAAQVARPIEWVDRAAAQWRRISPVAKLVVVAVGFLARKKIHSRQRRHLTRSRVVRAIRLLPIVLSAARMFAARRR